MDAPQKRTALRNVFISYKRDCRDRDLVVRLEADLRKAGVNVWRDETSIAPGSPWDQSVKRGIRACSEFLVVLSPESVESNNVMSELHYAMNTRKWVIPLLHAKCDKPLVIQRQHHVDFSDSYETGFAALMDLPAPAPTWRQDILRFLKRTRMLGLVAVLAIVLGIGTYWRFAPSETSFTVAGVDLMSRKDANASKGPIPAIRVRVENRGGRPSTLVGGYRLTFPPEVPIEEQDLRFAEPSTRVVPGHGSIDIRLTASGLEPTQLGDGSYLNNTETVARLPGRLATLHYQIEESSGIAKDRSAQFPAERIGEFVRRMLPSAVPGASDDR